MKIILILISIALTYIFFNVYKEFFKDRVIERAIEKKIEEKEHGYFSSKRISKYLKSRGFSDLKPINYILLKFIMSILLFICFFVNYGILISIFVSIIGFFLVDMAIELSNKQDNKKIVVDIVRVFDSIKIQIYSGVFITDILKESYLIARNKRFKKALRELSSELTLTNNLADSIDQFNTKFNCKFIDIFCLAIRQGNESGQINAILEDVSSSMKEIDLIIEKEETEKVKMKISFIQLLVYLGILAVVIYGIFNEISNGINFF